MEGSNKQFEMDDREIDLKQDVIEQKLEKIFSEPDYPFLDLNWAKHVSRFGQNMIIICFQVCDDPAFLCC